MLSSCEYELLSYIFENHSVSVQDIADHFGLEKLDRDTDAVLITLHLQGLIDMDFDRNCSILPAGVRALLMCDDARKKHTEDKAEKQEDIKRIEEQHTKNFKRNFLIAIISSITGSLVTLFVEHFNEVIAFIKNLFSV